MKLAAVIARKEILDHLRDRRSILSSAMMALLGPGVVFLVSRSGRTRGDEGEAVLLGMLSVFALVVSFSGAADVAMDSAAGERERRSLVPLLLNPVRAREIIVGKWMAVTMFAIAAVIINTLGLSFVLWSGAPSVLARQGLRLVVWIGLGLVPLTLLGAATNLLIAVLCRTTKEANTASKMLVFVPMLVGMFLVFFPAWVGRVWFLLPIVGQQALVGLREPSVPVARGVILALVTASATILPLAGATRVLRRNDVLSA
jgi:ABC-type Na+ efflux pump permease subunit